MRTAAVSLSLVAALAVSTVAAAQPGLAGPMTSAAPGLAPLATAPAPEQTVTHSYRGQVFLTDLAAFGVVLASARADGSGVYGARIGAAIYTLGGPAIHLANGNTRAAWRSLGLRVALPAAGAVVGLAIGASGSACEADHCDGGFAAIGGMLLGGAIGMASAMVIDWAFLAKRTERVMDPGSGWAPALAVTPSGVSLGAQGRF